MANSDAAGPAMAAIGHNQPPTSEILADQYRDMESRLEAIADRANAMPREIDSDDQIESLAAIVKDARAMAKDIDAARLAENKPLRDRIKEVDGYFRPREDRASRIKTAAERVLTDYQRRKEAEARRIAAEEAERARREAAAKLAEAADVPAGLGSDLAMMEAEAAEARAGHAAAAAHGSAADLTRQRTAAGTVTTRTFWNFTIENSAAIPLDLLRPYFGIDAIEKAVRAYVAANKDTAPLPGVRIFQDTKAAVR